MQKRLIALIICCYGMLMGAAFLRPLIIQKIIDDGLVSKNFRYVAIFSFFLFLLAMLEGGIEIIQARFFVVLKSKIVLSLYTKVFQKLMYAKLNYFSQNNSVEINNKVSTDINSISILVDSNMMSALSCVLQIISGIVGLFVVNWKLAFLVLAFVPAKYLLTHYFSRKKERITENWIEELTDFSAWFGDTVNGIREIKLWGLYRDKSKEMRSRQRKVLDLGRDSTLLETYNSTSDSLLQWVIVSALYGIGGYLVCGESLSLGGLTAFISYSNYVIGPIALVFNLRFLFAQIKPSMQRIQELFRTEVEHNGGLNKNICLFEKELSFDKVTFSYSDQQLLQDVDFCIYKGEKVAVVGDNGSGKSTLISLILRFLSPQSGGIYVDGINIEDYNLEQYRALFGVVSQDIYLFKDTVKNNVLLGKTKEFDVLKNMCEKMDLQELINKLPEGFESKLEKNGENLSGGERQKIALVRAMVKDAPILILDEATANIDLRYSRFLQRLLIEEFPDKTMIIITHKVDHLKGIDRIFRME